MVIETVEASAIEAGGAVGVVSRDRIEAEIEMIFRGPRGGNCLLIQGRIRNPCSCTPHGSAQRDRLDIAGL